MYVVCACHNHTLKWKDGCVCNMYLSQSHTHMEGWVCNLELVWAYESYFKNKVLSSTR